MSELVICRVHIAGSFEVGVGIIHPTLTIIHHTNKEVPLGVTLFVGDTVENNQSVVISAAFNKPSYVGVIGVNISIT